MAELLVTLDNYRNGVFIRVDNGSGEGNDVGLRLDAEEEGDAPYEYRSLTPAEARALAAALVHFAGEVE